MCRVRPMSFSLPPRSPQFEGLYQSAAPGRSGSLMEINREPKILGFLCNWCGYAGADMAGTSRMTYPANIRIIRVPCSGRVDSLFIIKGFQQGADGILVV